MRPIKYLSMMESSEETVRLFTSYDAQIILPPAVLSMNKSLSIASSWYLNLIFGVNRLNSFRPKNSEFDTAAKIIDRFRFYRDDKQPGEEYRVKREVMDILRFNDCITIVDDKEFSL